MDDQTARQLTRQLKIMNIWISIFGSLILVVLLFLGYFVYKIVTFVNDTNQKIENLSAQTKDTFDVKSKVCTTDTVGGFLQDKTTICKR